MQIVRTIVWFVVLFVLLAFSFFNWKPVEVQIWPTLVMETKLPALVIIAAASVTMAPQGARAAHAMDVAQLKRVFAMILYALAAYMLYRGLGL